MDSSGDRPALPEGAFAPLEVAGPLGSRPGGAYRVRQAAAAGAKRGFLVGEHFADAAVGDDGHESSFLREARRIAVLTNLNVARVQGVTVHGKDVVVLGELVEGERLVEIWGGAAPLDVSVRWILDVLSGLATLHTLRDAKQQPLRLAHGEVSPSTIAIGVDGVARLLHSVARRAPGARLDPASVGYVAPEVLAGEAYDARADVFGAGVLLWEALAGKRLVELADPAEVAAHFRAGGLPAPTLQPKAEWARGLVEVSARALSPSPDDRFPTAAAMAAELRKGAGLKLAPASTAAAFAKSALADRARARAERWAAAEPPPAATPVPVKAASPEPPRAEPRRPPPPVAPAPVDEVSGIESIPPSAISDVVSAAPITPRVDAAVPTPRVGPAESPAPPAAASPPAPPTAAAAAATPSVVELGSESLLEAPDSVPPPSATPASALGGFVIDPFAGGGRRGPVVPFAAPMPTPPPFAVPGPPPQADVDEPARASAPAALQAPAPVEAGVVASPADEPSPVSGAPTFASAMAAPGETPAPPPAATVAARRAMATVRIRKADVESTILAARGGGGGPSTLKTIGLGAGAGLIVILVGMFLLRGANKEASPAASSSAVTGAPPIESPVLPNASDLASAPGRAATAQGTPGGGGATTGAGSPAADTAGAAVGATTANTPAASTATTPASTVTPSPVPSQGGAPVAANPGAAPASSAASNRPPVAPAWKTNKKRTTFTPDTL